MNNDDDLSSGQLLRDIEEISQALYLHKAPSEAELLQSKHQFGSDSKAVVQDVFHKKKKSSIWQWKPLKTLTHIRSHRFDCFFFLHVHSIEGLASNFNDLILCVSWKRKDVVFRTHPVRVFQGIAEFEETLMHQCSVYVSRNGPQNSVKYEPKLFLLHPSVIGVPTLDIGKHWVDLARLLPLTLDELEEEKRTSGKWTTSFKLKGKAKGAMLNVSLGFSILGDNPFDSSRFMKVSEIIGVSGQTTIRPSADIAQISSNSALNRLGVPRKSSNEFHAVSSQSLDLKFHHEVSSDSKSELAQSITFLYQKLDEGKFTNLIKSDSLHENLVPLNLKSASLTEFVSEDTGKELEDIDFIVIEQGIELPVKDELKHNHDCTQNIQKSVIETAAIAESFPDDVPSFSQNGESNSKHKHGFDNLFGGARDGKYEENNKQVKEPTGDEPQTVSCNFLASKSAELNSSPNVSKFFEQENNMKSKPSYGSGKVRSLSVDDITESVANEFLDMLGIEHNDRDMSSDSETESPRERLLKQFEKECCAFGDSVLNLDAAAEQMEANCVSRTGSGRVACSDDFDLSMAIQEAEKDYNWVTQSLRSRRNAKMLENLETETLMQKWGLNEKVFQNSPQATSGGFGSPIYVPPEESPELPPLGEGLGPLIQTIGGGFLRSMSSSLFRRARNGAKLIMQVSNPVVLPAMMGSGVMDILQFWASGGAENMFVEANEVMPLLDITGKTIQQVSLETECCAKKSITRFNECGSLLDHGVSNNLFCMQKTDGEMLVVENAQSPGSISENLHSEYVSLEGLIPLALANIEALSIEGLRIQSGLSYEEASSSIRTQFIGNCIPKSEKVELDGVVGPKGISVSQLLDLKNENNFNELMRLSISLDEWVRLDAADVDYEGEVDGHTLKILAAHHAKFFNLDGEQLTKVGSGSGLFGNNFTLALRLQLRDPLRNYEIVGEPMLALVQVERVSIPPPQEMVNRSTQTNGNKKDDLNEELAKAGNSFQENYKKTNAQVIPLFEISEVHIAGLNDETNDRRLLITGKQHQSGSRWFFSSGMNRISKRPFSESNAIIKPSSQHLRKQAGDILWSISSHVQHTTKWKELAELNCHVRNPDIILPNEPVRSLKAS